MLSIGESLHMNRVDPEEHHERQARAWADREESIVSKTKQLQRRFKQARELIEEYDLALQEKGNQETTLASQVGVAMEAAARESGTSVHSASVV